MTLSRATYCTREDVLSVLQQQQSPKGYALIDRAIESATGNIDSRCHRTFHPYLATKMFTWPDANSSARSWRLWLDGNDLVSASLVTSGSAVITSYFLEPQRYGPPYTHIEINQASSDSFSSGSTNQRAISITGTWSYGAQVQVASALVGTINAIVTSLTVADGSAIGVGDLLLVESERMIVVGRTLVSTGQTLQTPLTAAMANTSVAVTTGSAYAIGEVITLDSEQMLITDIAGNTLLVERAVNSTVLATHTGSTIYAPRTLRVTRGVNGTTATTHLDTTTVSVSVVPAPVHSLAIGESLVEFQQLATGYARTAGSGDNERSIGSGPGLNDLRCQVEAGFARKVRMRAV